MGACAGGGGGQTRAAESDLQAGGIAGLKGGLVILPSGNILKAEVLGNQFVVAVLDVEIDAVFPTAIPEADLIGLARLHGDGLVQQTAPVGVAVDVGAVVAAVGGRGGQGGGLIALPLHQRAGLKVTVVNVAVEGGILQSLNAEAIDIGVGLFGGIGVRTAAAAEVEEDSVGAGGDGKGLQSPVGVGVRIEPSAGGQAGAAGVTVLDLQVDTELVDFDPERNLIGLTGLYGNGLIHDTAPGATVLHMDAVVAVVGSVSLDGDGLVLVPTGQIAGLEVTVDNHVSVGIQSGNLEVVKVVSAVIPSGFNRGIQLGVITTVENEAQGGPLVRGALHSTGGTQGTGDPGTGGHEGLQGIILAGNGHNVHSHHIVGVGLNSKTGTVLQEAPVTGGLNFLHNIVAAVGVSHGQLAGGNEGHTARIVFPAAETTVLEVGQIEDFFSRRNRHSAHRNDGAQHQNSGQHGNDFTHVHYLFSS